MSSAPAAPWYRGTIEGYYGPPWTPQQRRAHLEFCRDVGFDTVLHAPKDDPFHRLRWREPYPCADIDRIAELAAYARAHGVRFVHALHPAVDMRFADDTEHAALAAKAAQLVAAGVRHVALLFDDVPMALSDPADLARFGPGAGGLGAAHGETVRRFRAGFPSFEPLLVCPTDYAGIDSSPYRDAFARSAPDDVVLLWTGRDVVVGSITRDEIDRAAMSYQRPLLLWDNFPVNDFEPSRLFLGPLVGRPGNVAGSALVGILGNAMPVERASRLSLATVADWARDPAGYDPGRAGAAALAAQADASLAPLVRVCSTWPPSADQDPELSAATAAALAGDASAIGLVENRLTELARCCRDARGPADLIAELQPWLAGAAATAAAGLSAIRALREPDDAALHAAARAMLHAADEHYENVLRPIVAPFVRAVLLATAPPDAAAGRPVAVVLGTGRTDASADFVGDCGFAVREFDGSLDGASVVLVDPAADARDVRRVAAARVPVIAWDRALVALGLATHTARTMLRRGVTIVAPDDRLAAGCEGATAVYRGPGWAASARPGAAARVIARGPDDEDGAAIFRYGKGDLLADGSVAPAERIGLFLAGTGAARWLLSDGGRRLVAAALESARAAGEAAKASEAT